MRKARRAPSKYTKIKLEGVDVIAKYGKVVVPAALQDRIVESYHDLLQHPGMTRMEATIRHVFDWRGLREKVEQHCRTCKICQLTKKQRKEYGHLPPKEAETIPWKRVNVDMIGPYTVRTPKGVRELLAMTMIDPVTGWFEIAPCHTPQRRITSLVILVLHAGSLSSRRRTESSAGRTTYRRLTDTDTNKR